MHKHIGEENIAAVIMEPIQGEGGFIVPSPGFVKGIADFCAANGIVFIADEIQSGMGRAGRWFAIEDEGVVPDLVTTAKSLGGGLPISAVTGRAEIYGRGARRAGSAAPTAGTRSRRRRRSPCSTRSSARTCSPARGRSGETSWADSASIAERFDVVGEVRGRGAMCAIELVADRATKEPLDAAAMNAIAAGCLARRRDRAHGRDVRERRAAAAADQPSTTALLDDGLDVLEEAIAAATA